jgi:UrcA family protein
MNSNIKTGNRATLAYAIAMWLACVLVASNAHADDQARSETVKFADLNLDTPAGVEALYGRIHAAARRVCEQPAGELAATGPCMTKAESKAIGKVNLPLLTAYYQKKTGNRPPALTATR